MPEVLSMCFSGWKVWQKITMIISFGKIAEIVMSLWRKAVRQNKGTSKMHAYRFSNIKWRENWIYNNEYTKQTSISYSLFSFRWSQILLFVLTRKHHCHLCLTIVMACKENSGHYNDYMIVKNVSYVCWYNRILMFSQQWQLAPQSRVDKPIGHCVSFSKPTLCWFSYIYGRLTKLPTSFSAENNMQYYIWLCGNHISGVTEKMFATEMG